MITSTILGLLIPFIGTSLGAACVLFMKNELSVKTTKMLSGFAAGVMIAASVWSLLIPALDVPLQRQQLFTVSLSHYLSSSSLNNQAA